MLKKSVSPSSERGIAGYSGEFVIMSQVGKYIKERDFLKLCSMVKFSTEFGIYLTT